jgi:hypothetical protein
MRSFLQFDWQALAGERRLIVSISNGDVTAPVRLLLPGNAWKMAIDEKAAGNIQKKIGQVLANSEGRG